MIYTIITEQIGLTGKAYAFYLGDGSFEFRPGNRLFCLYRGSPQSLQANTEIIIELRPR
jgi:hypothetical protein